jgi:hypothetical protein
MWSLNPSLLVWFLVALLASIFLAQSPSGERLKEKLYLPLYLILVCLLLMLAWSGLSYISRFFSFLKL